MEKFNTPLTSTVLNVGVRDIGLNLNAYEHAQILGNKVVSMDSGGKVVCKTRFTKEVFDQIGQKIRDVVERIGLSLAAYYDGFSSGNYIIYSNVGGTPVPSIVATAGRSGLYMTGDFENINRMEEIYASLSEFYDLSDRVALALDSESSGKPIGIEYWYWSKGELHQESYKKAPTTNLIDELYEEIDPRVMVESFYDSKDTILFMHGDPGVGKSYIIQYGIEYLSRTGKIFNPEAYHWKENTTPCIWYVKDLMVLGLDEFWSGLVAREPELVVLDDISSGIGPRDQGEKGNFVEKFLSISDGIFRLKTKFIFTTNLSREKIDGALLRPGRCFDYFEMKAMTTDYAESLMAVLLEKDGLRPGPVFSGMSSVPQAVFTQALDRLIRKPASYYRKPR